MRAIIKIQVQYEEAIKDGSAISNILRGKTKFDVQMGITETVKSKTIIFVYSNFLWSQNGLQNILRSDVDIVLASVYCYFLRAELNG